MLKIFAVIACSLALASCAQWRAEQIARINAAQDTQCQSYGAPQGSPAYYDCRMRLNELAEQRREAAQAAFANFTATGLAIMANSQPQPAPQPANPREYVCVTPANTLVPC